MTLNSVLTLHSLLLLLLCQEILSESSPSSQSEVVEWAKVFPGPSSRTNIPMNCKFEGKDICCSALEEPKGSTEQSAIPLDMIANLEKMGECVTTKEYFPSPYETRHLKKSKELARIKDDKKRHHQLIDFMTSRAEVEAAKIWLERVRLHMHGKVKSGGNYAKTRDGGRRTSNIGHDTNAHPDDEEYMSKFVITTSCVGGASRQWVEWIEPLSVHGRHPFSMHHCRSFNRTYGTELEKGGLSRFDFAHIVSTDYVLLQSRGSLAEYEVTSSKAYRKTKKVLFDAGTSRFDSSLFWFTCAYSQRDINFDSIFGWEYSFLNPRDFWKHVPPRWKPRYHFFNKGITSSPTDADSVQTLTKQLGITKNDFVVFKLDIDTPETEIPIALDLLQGTSGFSEYVDEFFFELHFRCEIMMPCGWDRGMPEEFQGLKLNRAGALQLFADLRHSGIRAHFWP